MLTAKRFEVGSSNFGFVHLDNWATHSKKLNLDEVRGDFRKSAHLTSLLNKNIFSRVNNEGSVTNLMQTSFYGLLWYLRVFEAK